jgi:hypothetical protein
MQWTALPGIYIWSFNVKKMAQTSINYGDDEWTGFVGVGLVSAFFYTAQKWAVWSTLGRDPAAPKVNVRRQQKNCLTIHLGTDDGQIILYLWFPYRCVISNSGVIHCPTQHVEC